MQKLSNQEKVKPWMGVIIFVIALGALFILSLVSTVFKMGMLGTVLTELGLLAVAVVFCLITKTKIKEMFPVKKVTVADVFGCIFLTIGAFFSSLILIGITSIFDPIASEEIESLYEGIFGNNLNYFGLFICVAVIPAICEESLMRGAVLSCFRGLKKDWVICLIVGVMFGILHMDPLRIPNTAFFGAILAFVMVKKNNIILPMAMHLANNAVASFAGFIATKASGDGGAMVQAAVDSIGSVSGVTILGSYLLTGFAAPIFLVLGAMLLDRKNHKPRRFAIAGAITAVLFIVGVVITVVPTAKTLFGNNLLTWNYEYTVTEEELSKDNLAEANLTITEERTVMIVVSATGSGGELTFTVADEKGNILLEKSSTGFLIVSEGIKLEPGQYSLYFTGGDDLMGKKFVYEVVVK